MIDQESTYTIQDASDNYGRVLKDPGDELLWGQIWSRDFEVLQMGLHVSDLWETVVGVRIDEYERVSLEAQDPVLFDFWTLTVCVCVCVCASVCVSICRHRGRTFFLGRRFTCHVGFTVQNLSTFRFFQLFFFNVLHQISVSDYFPQIFLCLDNRRPLMQSFWWLRHQRGNNPWSMNTTICSFKFSTVICEGFFFKKRWNTKEHWCLRQLL